ncbi:MAG: NADH-quinone oxidoreductase subunit NuoH [Caldilineae bacterium]|nr:NADH-quinone oxidoreductase subunit NuoH [Chloroflexota bacterium]MCB9176498.1 NADH-quinone oxidoreductase subunit NuoH [Caldilineae bacterium]
MSGIEILEVSLISAAVIGALLTGFAYATWFERKVIARMQARLGPNKAGPAGLLLPAADGVKLIFKENVIPAAVDKGMYFLAPLISMIVALLAFAVIPLGDPIQVPWREGLMRLGIADFNVALLYVLGVSSFAVYGISLAGWASNNKYALIGGMRSAAQMISYELAMGISLLGVVMIVGSMSVTDIVLWQKSHVWLILVQPLGFVIYAITALAETNRAPFDMPEAEQELIAGYHVEYTGMRFALFFQAEYINMLTVSALGASLFLGGYALPFVELPWFGDLAVLLAKVVLGMFMFVWIRATVPRLRYDQLMDFGWKVLLPLSILNLVLTAVGIVAYQNWM